MAVTKTANTKSALTVERLCTAQKDWYIMTKSKKQRVASVPLAPRNYSTEKETPAVFVAISVISVTATVTCSKRGKVAKKTFATSLWITK